MDRIEFKTVQSLQDIFETPEEVQKMRDEAVKQGKTPMYDGTCREKYQEDPDIPFCIRLKTPNEGETSFHDLLAGEITFQNNQIDDMIIRRTDGSPTYNLCVAIDDIDMQISVETAGRLMVKKYNKRNLYRHELWIKHDQRYKPFPGHLNSFLIHKDLYWKAGGYDESYTGHHWGDREFFERIDKVAKAEGVTKVCVHCNRKGRHGIVTDQVENSTFTTRAGIREGKDGKFAMIIADACNFKTGDFTLGKPLQEFEKKFAKFFDDVYYNNAYYARVGGISNTEV